MSFFVACHAFEQLARSVQINISLNSVPVGSARGVTGLPDMRIKPREGEEGFYRFINELAGRVNSHIEKVRSRSHRVCRG
jgi:hypothetical protein